MACYGKLYYNTGYLMLIIDHGIKAPSPFVLCHGALILALSLLEGLGLSLFSSLALEIETWKVYVPPFVNIKSLFAY